MSCTVPHKITSKHTSPSTYSGWQPPFPVAQKYLFPYWKHFILLIVWPINTVSTILTTCAFLFIITNIQTIQGPCKRAAFFLFTCWCAGKSLSVIRYIQQVIVLRSSAYHPHAFPTEESSKRKWNQGLMQLLLSTPEAIKCIVTAVNSTFTCLF